MSKHDAAAGRRHRLEQLLDLALAYRACTRKELARSLGRDPTKLVPGTGIPKLDVIVELAEALDWPVGEVVSHLWSTAGPRRVNGQTSRQVAGVCLRTARATQARGDFLESVQAAARGLQEPGAPPALRRALQAELAEAYFALGSHAEAGALARDLLASWRQQAPRSRDDRRTQAAAHFLAGQTRRELMCVQPRRRAILARSARRELERALAQYRRLALDQPDPAAEGRAHTCLGAMLEVDVVLRRLRATDAVTRITLGLERTRDASRLPPELLESYGWWCIYGCHIALRHLADEREMHHAMAIFTNKADEIAGAVDSWALRERVFTMQYAGDLVTPRVVDVEDVRIITGTMGRFPAFRETGWRLLETAQIIKP